MFLSGRGNQATYPIPVASPLYKTEVYVFVVSNIWGWTGLATFGLGSLSLGHYYWHPFIRNKFPFSLHIFREDFVKSLINKKSGIFGK